MNIIETLGIIELWIKLNLVTWLATIIFTVVIRIKQKSLKEWVLDSKMQGKPINTIIGLIAIPTIYFLIITYESALSVIKPMDKQINKERMKDK